MHYVLDTDRVVEEILDIRVFSHIFIVKTETSELSKRSRCKHRYDLMTEKYELQKKHFEEIQNRDNTDIEDRENN